MTGSDPDEVVQLITTLADNLLDTDKAFAEVGDCLHTLVYRVPLEYVEKVGHIADEWGDEYVNFHKAKDLSKIVAQDALSTLDGMLITFTMLHSSLITVNLWSPGYLTSVLPALQNEGTEIEQKKRIMNSFVSVGFFQPVYLS